MKTVRVKKLAGEFGENKDVAKDIRVKDILPALKEGEEIAIDFDGMTGATQSFIHAMFAEPIRKYPESFFSLVICKNCSELVRTVITIVSDYMQESLMEQG